MHTNQLIWPQITSKWDTYAASSFFSCVENPHNNFISLASSKSKAAQMAQWVQTLATNSDDLSPITSPTWWNGRNGSTSYSMASTYMNWLQFLVHGLTKVCNSVPRDTVPSSGLPGHCTHVVPDMHADKHICINKIKINKTSLKCR